MDLVLINGTCRKALQDVSVRRGADVGSDHHLVTANLQVKLRNNGPGKTPHQQFDVKKLCHLKAKSAFMLLLTNTFKAVEDVNHANTEPAGI